MVLRDEHDRAKHVGRRDGGRRHPRRRRWPRRALSKEVGLEYVDLDRYPLNAAAACLLPEQLHAGTTLSRSAGSTARPVVAVARPDNVMAMDDVRTIIGRDIHAVVACESQIDAYIERMYPRSRDGDRRAPDRAGAQRPPPRAERRTSAAGAGSSRGTDRPPRQLPRPAPPPPPPSAPPSAEPDLGLRGGSIDALLAEADVAPDESLTRSSSSRGVRTRPRRGSPRAVGPTDDRRQGHGEGLLSQPLTPSRQDGQPTPGAMPSWQARQDGGRRGRADVLAGSG